MSFLRSFVLVEWSNLCSISLAKTMNCNACSKSMPFGTSMLGTSLVSVYSERERYPSTHTCLAMWSVLCGDIKTLKGKEGNFVECKTCSWLLCPTCQSVTFCSLFIVFLSIRHLITYTHTRKTKNCVDPSRPTWLECSCWVASLSKAQPLQRVLHD